MGVSAKTAADYLARYVRRYREEYGRFTSPPPAGGGFPKLTVSPYLSSPELHCHIAEDGALLADFSWSPEYRWEIAGGPGILVDFPETRTPAWVVNMLKTYGVYGKDIGLYRIVAKDIPDEVWAGALPSPIEVADTTEGSTTIRVRRYSVTWSTLIRLYTFGAFGLILDLKLPKEDSEFWTPRVVRDLGIATADRAHKRFFHYLELLRHTHKAAWDPRGIWARVHVDLRRDFAHTFRASGQPVASIAFDAPEAMVWDYAIASPSKDARLLEGRLGQLAKVIERFGQLLEEQGTAEEHVFHEFLRSNPTVLDLYSQQIFTKPRFTYPEGKLSAVGKAFVEPDFLIAYADRSYRLVELEKPDKRIATVQGQPRAELTQDAFQIGEFRTFIANHYDRLAKEFPGISSRCSSTVVISRDTERSLGPGREKNDYLDLVKGMFPDIEILLYDDLLARAKQALMNISRLSSEA
jgi:hypothetical protein